MLSTLLRLLAPYSPGGAAGSTRVRTIAGATILLQYALRSRVQGAFEGSGIDLNVRVGFGLCVDLQVAAEARVENPNRHEATRKDQSNSNPISEAATGVGDNS